MGCYFLLQGIFPTQALNPCLLQWKAGSLPLSHQKNPMWVYTHVKSIKLNTYYMTTWLQVCYITIEKFLNSALYEQFSWQRWEAKLSNSQVEPPDPLKVYSWGRVSGVLRFLFPFKWEETSEWTPFSGEPVKNPEYSSLHAFEHTTGVKKKSRLSFWQQTNRAFGILSTSYRSFTCSKSKAVKFEIRIIAYKLLISFGEQLHL